MGKIFSDYIGIYRRYFSVAVNIAQTDLLICGHRKFCGNKPCGINIFYVYLFVKVDISCGIFLHRNFAAFIMVTVFAFAAFFPGSCKSCFGNGFPISENMSRSNNHAVFVRNLIFRAGIREPLSAIAFIIFAVSFFGAGRCKRGNKNQRRMGADEIKINTDFFSKYGISVGKSSFHTDFCGNGNNITAKPCDEVFRRIRNIDMGIIAIVLKNFCNGINGIFRKIFRFSGKILGFGGSAFRKSIGRCVYCMVFLDNCFRLVEIRMEKFVPLVIPGKVGMVIFIFDSYKVPGMIFGISG